MEFLGKVWDGSEKEVRDGYSLCKAVAADIESKQVIPLYCEGYSSCAELWILKVAIICGAKISPFCRRYNLDN
jgi:hypothetical protein